jgi:hypothetical protein
MRGFVLALLLGAVLQSWGQKFPSVIGNLPKLHKELPGAGVCPKLPKCFFEQEKIDITFPCYGKAVMWFTTHTYCETTYWVSSFPCNESNHVGPVRVQGNSIGAAINDLVRQRPLYWVLVNKHGVNWMVGRTTEFTGLP